MGDTLGELAFLQSQDNTKEITDAKDGEDTLKDKISPHVINSRAAYGFSKNHATNKIVTVGLDLSYHNGGINKAYGCDLTNNAFVMQTAEYSSSWSENKGYPPNVTSFTKVVRFGPYIYASGLDSSDSKYKVWRATPKEGDETLTWELVWTARDTVIVVGPCNMNCSNTYLYVSEYGNYPPDGPKVWRTSDGTTWSDIWTGTAGTHVHALNCDPYVAGSVWFATGENGKVYHSSDNGDTWTAIIDDWGWQCMQISFTSKHVYFASDNYAFTAMAMDKTQKLPFAIAKNHHKMIAVPGGVADATFYNNAVYGAVDPTTDIFYLCACDISSGGNTAGLFFISGIGEYVSLYGYKEYPSGALDVTPYCEVFFAEGDRVYIGQYYMGKIGLVTIP